jgi:hypothetical protein
MYTLQKITTINTPLHATILLWLVVKPNKATFDDFVCAKIPDATTHLILFQSVKSHLIHGPFGVISHFAHD